MATKKPGAEGDPSSTEEYSATEPTLDPNVLDNLVYIAGSARGGTSLMMHMFNMHPDILGFPGPTSFMANVWFNRRKVRDRVLRIIWWTPGWLFVSRIGSDSHRAIVQKFRPQIGQAFSSGNLRKIYDLYPVLRYALMEPEERPKLPKAWSDKANDVGGLDDIAQAYPNARFLFIVRDPRASVNSLFVRELQFRGVDENHAEVRRSIIRSTIYWRNNAQGMIRHLNKYPERTKLVRFEDLVAEPNQTLSDIFEFSLGEKQSSSFINEIVQNVKYGATNDSDETGKGISTAPLDRWRQRLPQRSQSLIESVAGPVAAQLNYNCKPDRIAAYRNIVAAESSKFALLKQLAKQIYLDATAPNNISGRSRS